MSGDQFQVTTATLRTVAGDLGRHTDEAQNIADKARDADVETKSWGALGLGLGLYSGYTSARNTANRSIGEVVDFLQHAQRSLDAAATAYDQADRSGHERFAAINRAMSGGGGRS